MRRVILAATLIGISGFIANAQTTLPRVQAGDVQHIGQITLPAGVTPNAIAVDGSTIWIGCYGGGKNGVASYQLPASGLGVATPLVPCTQLPNLNLVHAGGTYLDIVPGGILPFTNDAGVRCIVISGWTYYDGGGGQIRSHWVWCPSTGGIQGPFQMEVTDVGLFGGAPSLMSSRQMSAAEKDELSRAPVESLRTTPLSRNNLRGPMSALAASWPRESMVAGYMGLVPAEWVSAMGFTALTGQCCIPIIFRSSLGPTASLFDPKKVGVVEPIPSKMAVGYPYEHSTLGRWEDSPPGTYYGGSDQLGSVGFPSGTRSVLFTGRHGDTWCYGPATDDKSLVGTIFGGDPLPRCYDPYDALRGNHGAPYIPTMWAYDANDLLAVKTGSKKPWEVFPYAKWQLPGMPLDKPYYLRAGYYEDTKRWYYVGDASRTAIEVFSISGGGGGGPVPPVATNDSYTSASVPFTAAAPGVLANDDLKGNTDVTAVLVSGASFTLQPNGGFTFAPVAGFTGSASFTYQARSVSAGSSNTATVTVTVQAASTANVTVDPAVTHQTMRGWEVAGEANQDRPDFPAYQGAALDKVVEVGINRMALGVRSGSENPTNAWAVWQAAGHPATKADGTSCTLADAADPYCKWRFARYLTINDNADSNSAGAGRFHWSEIDSTIDKVVNPLRAKLTAKGESLFVSLVYVSFWGTIQPPGQVNVHQTPAEYAEFMVEAFTHIRDKYGWVPDSIDTVLEPDNVTNWSGTLLGQTIAATGARLAAAGFTPKFSVPSTTNMTTAPAWFDNIWAVTAARPYIAELSYHRYSGVSTASLQAIASKAQAAGINTSMLEWWDNANNHTVLHEDLTIGRNSAWQQNEIVNVVGAYPTENTMAISRIDPATPTVAVLYDRTKFFRQYYTAARMGAVRVGATSTAGTLAPLAFRNTNGRYSVVVKATAGATITVGGLPAGTYGITYTASSTGSPNVADLTGSHPDQTIAAGQVLTTSIPAYGVITVIGKAGGTSPVPPVAVNDAYSVSHNTPLTVAAPSVLVNDDLKGLTDVTVFQMSSNPAGALVWTGNGFVYTPPTGFSGPTSFTYQARSVIGGNSNTATVTLTVAAQSDVNCVETESLWGPGAPPEGWSACAANTQFRDRTWTTTVKKEGAGVACVWTGSGPVGTKANEHQTQACSTTGATTVTMSSGGVTKTCTLTAGVWVCAP